jgi:hypothetical protein
MARGARAVVGQSRNGVIAAAVGVLVSAITYTHVRLCARAPQLSRAPRALTTPLLQVYLPTYSPMAAASRARAAEAEDAAFAASRGEAPPAGATRGGSTWKAVAARRDGLK